MDTNFPNALNAVLGVEGGVSNDPNDHGGLTNKGVTQGAYDTYRTSKKLPKQPVTSMTGAELKDLYYIQYWLPAKCDQLKTGLDSIHFDMAVNAGPGAAARILQKAIGVVVDGNIGPKTLERINTMDAKVMIKYYVDKRVDFYVDLCVADNTQLKFLKGWIRRAISFCNK